MCEKPKVGVTFGVWISSQAEKDDGEPRRRRFFQVASLCYSLLSSQANWDLTDKSYSRREDAAWCQITVWTLLRRVVKGIHCTSLTFRIQDLANLHILRFPLFSFCVPRLSVPFFPTPAWIRFSFKHSHMEIPERRRRKLGIAELVSICAQLHQFGADKRRSIWN